jgi:hypothetical protein
MDAGLVEKALTLYGPLSLGWLLAVYLLKMVFDQNQQIMTAFMADTVAKAEMKSALERLAAVTEAKK